MWNNGKKCAVVLGFDFDAESMWATPRSGTPTPMSRGTYGARVGVPRVLELLNKYDIKATFFVPADTGRRHPDRVREIFDHGHEIGHHGDSHKSPVRMDRDIEKQGLEVGVETLQKLTGVAPKGYRSPSWDLSPNSAGLFEEFGFLWDSSMMADDFQLYRLEDDGRATDIVEIPVCWELDDAPHFMFNFSPAYYSGLSAPSKVYEIWASEFDGAYLNEGVFVLTMHPQIIGRYHRIVMLEKLIQYILTHQDVWFATCTELVEDWTGK